MGFTSAQDNSDWEDFLVYEELERDGKLTLRISEWLRFTDPVELLEKHRSHHSGSDPMLHTTMLKGFMDGSLGSRTAALFQPYSDDPGNVGLAQFKQPELNQLRETALPPDSSWASMPLEIAPGRWRCSHSMRPNATRARKVCPREEIRNSFVSASSTTRSSRPTSSSSIASWASSRQCSPIIC